MQLEAMQLEAYRIQSEPYYLPVGGRGRAVRGGLCEPACRSCSKARPAPAKRASSNTWPGGSNRPLITVAAHEDMTAADLAGRFLLAPEGTVWHDGPLTLAVRHGAICYLDEIVEARQDTTVVIHPLTDARRMLPLEKKNELSPRIPTSSS